MTQKSLSTFLVAIAAVTVAISLAGCSGGSAVTPDTIGDFKTISVGDTAAYKADLWPTGSEPTGQTKITSTDQYLSRFRDNEDGYIQGTPGTKGVKVGDVTFYRDSSGVEIGVFFITGPASGVTKIFSDGRLIGASKFTNPSRTIIVGQNEAGDADAELVAHLKDSVIIAASIRPEKGLTDAQKTKATAFIKAYESLLKKSGELH